MQSKTPLLQKLKIRSRCVTGVRTSSGHKLSWTFFLIFISLNVDLDRRIQNSQLLLYKDAPCNLIGISPFLDLVDKKEGPRTKQWLWCTFAISNDWGTRKWRENDQDYKIKSLLHILLAYLFCALITCVESTQEESINSLIPFYARWNHHKSFELRAPLTFWGPDIF